MRIGHVSNNTRCFNHISVTESLFGTNNWRGYRDIAGVVQQRREELDSKQQLVSGLLCEAEIWPGSVCWRRQPCCDSAGVAVSC